MLFSQRMENCGDFVEWLGLDLSREILMRLDDPSDIVRVSTVSRCWRQFVIANHLSKQLCIKIFPEVSKIDRVIETNAMEPIEAMSTDSMEYESLERDHRVFAFLAQGLASFTRKNCISKAIIASSTDNFPEESIDNTLVASDRVDERASYWSSKGASDPAVPEKLTYQLVGNLCVITEISVQPFQAFFQYGFPIYSAKAVRFRLGHPKFPMEIESDSTDEYMAGQISVDDKFIWTYTSPEFPMVQENSLQKFKLPEPVLCIGGILQIELLGRVQRQEMDGLFYICVSHVKVVGRPLSPAFDVEVLNPSGMCILKYNPDADYCMSPRRSPGESSEPSRLQTLTASLMRRGVRGWEQMIINTLLGNVVVVGDNESDDDEMVA